MLTVIVLIVFAVTAALDWLPGIKSKPKKETVVYGLLLVTALVVLFLYSLGVHMPEPSDAITAAVKAIFPVK
jgi:hypothetical protein